MAKSHLLIGLGPRPTFSLMKLKISSRRWKKSLTFTHRYSCSLSLATTVSKSKEVRAEKGRGLGGYGRASDIFQVRYMFIVSRSIEYRPTKTYCNRNISVGSVMQKVKWTTCGMMHILCCLQRQERDRSFVYHVHCAILNRFVNLSRHYNTACVFSPDDIGNVLLYTDVENQLIMK